MSGKVKIFIDGSEGTTGLRIHERFAEREDVELLPISSELRKDKEERKRLINSSDITFLCLPDAAAEESVSLVENDHVRIIDTSTAHRTMEGWAYGFPELSKEHREAIAAGNRIAVPGCYATGFISLVYPMVAEGLISADYPVSAFGISGYSGGGRKMIAAYEAEEREDALLAPREYALSQAHKHLKEMKKIPDAIFIVDPKKERICVQEAHALGITLIGIADTNCDPDELDYVIPGNDDAIRAVNLIVSKMADAVIEANQGEEVVAADAEEVAEEA